MAPPDGAEMVPISGAEMALSTEMALGAAEMALTEGAKIANTEGAEAPEEIAEVAYPAAAEQTSQDSPEFDLYSAVVAGA